MKTRYPIVLLLLSVFILNPNQLLASNSEKEFRKKAILFYNGILADSDPKTKLPQSHQGDPRLREWCHTYDASVCIMAFLAIGDIDRAKEIMDFYVDNQLIRRLGGVIEAVLNFSGKGKGINWQVRTGSNAWLGIASFHCYLATHEKKYLDFARQQADFLLSYQDEDPMSPTYGGIPLGPEGSLYNPKDQHIKWDETKPKFIYIYSTENNVDAWALFHMLAETTDLPEYKMAKARVEKWLKLVGYNAGEIRMNRGFYQMPDMKFAPDTHFWIVSALGLQNLEKWNPGLSDQLMQYAKKHSLVEVVYKLPEGKKIRVKGYDFISKNDPLIKERGKVVSPEWTFQAAVAYKLLADKTTNKELAQFYLDERYKLIESMLSMTENSKGKAYLPYATKGGVPIGHEFNTPKEGTRSVIGSAWAILALTDYDPLNYEKAKSFWNRR